MPSHSSGVVDPSRRCHYSSRSGHRPLWGARAPAQRQRARIYRHLHVQDWLKAQEIKTLYIRPGSPWENGHIESFMTSCAMNASTASSSAICAKCALSWRAGVSNTMNVVRTARLATGPPNEYAGTQMNRFDGGCAPPNPAPLAAAGVSGGTKDQRHKVAN